MAAPPTTSGVRSHASTPRVWMDLTIGGRPAGRTGPACVGRAILKVDPQLGFSASRARASGSPARGARAIRSGRRGPRPGPARETALSVPVGVVALTGTRAERQRTWVDCPGTPMRDAEDRTETEPQDRGAALALADASPGLAPERHGPERRPPARGSRLAVAARACSSRIQIIVPPPHPPPSPPPSPDKARRRA